MKKIGNLLAWIVIIFVIGSFLSWLTSPSDCKCFDISTTAYATSRYSGDFEACYERFAEEKNIQNTLGLPSSVYVFEMMNYYERKCK